MLASLRTLLVVISVCRQILGAVEIPILALHTLAISVVVQHDPRRIFVLLFLPAISALMLSFSSSVALHDAIELFFFILLSLLLNHLI